MSHEEESEALREDDILERNCAAPSHRLENEIWTSEQAEKLAQFVPEDLLRLLLFNKVHSTERICPSCMIRYKRPKNLISKTQIEQDLSGICSTKCFKRMTGGPDEDAWN